MLARASLPFHACLFTLCSSLRPLLLLRTCAHSNAALLRAATVRIAGSSQASPYACVAAGIASLWGPAHGGANEAVLNMLEAIG